MEEQDTQTHTVNRPRRRFVIKSWCSRHFSQCIIWVLVRVSAFQFVLIQTTHGLHTYHTGTVHLITPSALRAERSYFNYLASKRIKWQRQQPISLWLPSFHLFWQLADKNSRDVNVPDKPGSRVGRWHCWLALQVLGGTPEPWQQTVSPHPQLVRSRHT